MFEIDDLGTVSYFLGVQIIRDCTIRSITLIQDTYISKVLYKYSIQNYKSTLIPIDPGTLNLMISNPNQATKQEIEEYQSKMGSMTYLAIQICTDIAFIYSVLSRFLVNLLRDYLNTADQLLRYIQGSKYLVVVLGGNLDSDPDKGALYSYSDSDFTGDIEQYKSTSRYIFLFAGSIISSQSKYQSITALSTTEAEYYGLYKAMFEVAWL